jgi:hypothetical protein
VVILGLPHPRLVRYAALQQQPFTCQTGGGNQNFEVRCLACQVSFKSLVFGGDSLLVRIFKPLFYYFSGFRP